MTHEGSDIVRELGYTTVGLDLDGSWTAGHIGDWNNDENFVLGDAAPNIDMSQYIALPPISYSIDYYDVGQSGDQISAAQQNVVTSDVSLDLQPPVSVADYASDIFESIENYGLLTENILGQSQILTEGNYVEGTTKVTPEVALEIANNLVSGEKGFKPELGKGGSSWFVTEGNPYTGISADKTVTMNANIKALENHLVFREVDLVPMRDEIFNNQDFIREMESKFRQENNISPEEPITGKHKKSFKKMFKRAAESRMWDKVGEIVRSSESKVGEVVLESSEFSKQGDGLFQVVAKGEFIDVAIPDEHINEIARARLENKLKRAPTSIEVFSEKARLRNHSVKTINALKGARSGIAIAEKTIVKPLAVYAAFQDGYSLGTEINESIGTGEWGNTYKESARIAGGWTGAWAGGKAGAAAGALIGGGIGVLLFGVGSAPGAAFDGFIGGLAGSIGVYMYGSEAGEYYYDEATK